jgi:peptidoglycan-associated lipoprotein
VTPRTVAGFAAASLVLGMLAGCGEGGVTGYGGATPSSSSSAPMYGSGGFAASGAAGQVQSRIDELLAASPITFEQAGSTLTDEAKATLSRIGEAAAGAEGVRLAVTATDSSTNPDRAHRLSQERAEAVRAELAASGVPEDSIETEALGNEAAEPGQASAVQISAV